jgi:hypothetical protein
MRLSRLAAGLLCALGLLVATSAFAQKKDVVVTDRARQHFKAGVAYIDDPTGPKYEEAYGEFHQAYAESPSYKILSNIGLCALNLERDGEAIDAYTKFLAVAKAEDIPTDKRKLMERDIAMLKASLVTITISSVPADVTLIDERLPTKGSSVTNRYDINSGKLTLGIHPGQHRLTVKTDGYEPQIWEIDAASSSTHSHEFNLVSATKPNETVPVEQKTDPAKSNLLVTTPPETQTKSSAPTLVYVGLSATGAFAIAATVTGLIANTKKNDFNDVNEGGTEPVKARDLRDSFKSYALMTDLGIGAAIVSASATAIIYFTAPNKKQETKALASRIHVDPLIAPTQTGFSVSGQF